MSENILEPDHEIGEAHECFDCGADCNCGESPCVMCDDCADHECDECLQTCDCGYGSMSCILCDECREEGIERG